MAYAFSNNRGFYTNNNFFLDRKVYFQDEQLNSSGYGQAVSFSAEHSKFKV